MRVVIWCLAQMMAKSAADEILEATIRHQVYLQRLQASNVKQVVALLNKLDARLAAKLARQDIPSWSRERLEKQLREIRKIVKTAYKPVVATLNESVAALAVYEAGFQLDMFKRTIPVVLYFVTPSRQQLVAAVKARPFQGRLLRDWYADLERGTFRRLKVTLQIGYVEGTPTDQIVRNLIGTAKSGYTDGVLQQSRRGAEAAVRTSLNHTANIARNEVYKENADYIKGVQWVSTLDGRTTLICAGRDGKVYPVDGGPRPPAHFSCRSTTIPILKSWKELGISLPESPPGTRASLNGQVPGDLTYNDFLRKQPKAFQEEVLGVKAAQLFRRGDLPIDRFVDRKGRSYTLDELRTREPEAWKAAGFN